jgi:type I restriction enzyme S subunit
MKISECCISVSDGDHQPPPKAKEGIPFITISNFTKDNTIDFSNTMFVPKNYFTELEDYRKVREGDILYSVVGSFGQPVYVDFCKPFVFQRHIAILRPNTDVVRGRFLYYSLMNPIFYRKADNLAVGAAQRTLTLTELRNMEIDVPDIETQDRVIAVLNAIDEKIKNNTTINDNLQKQLKATFDYWFTQYNFPNEKNQPYKSSGGNMKYDDSIQHYVPATWETKSIGDTDIYVSDYTANGSFKGLADNVLYNQGDRYAMLIRVVDFNNNFDPKGDFVYVDKHGYDYLKKCHLHGGEIIICNVGNTGLTYRCPYLNIPMALGPNGIVVNLDSMNNYLYLHFQSEIGQFQLQAISSGSIQKKFNKTDFRDLRICFPPTDIVNKFNDIVNPIFSQINVIWEENRKLAGLRDWLLPMLMNGQASISD